MISCKMAMKIVALDPLTGVVVISELIEAGRVLASEVERLQTRIAELEAVIRFYFSLNPDTSDGTEEIGSNITPMPDHVREIIIATVREAV